MIENILYMILAILGLGVLIFIHELGHYFMARRVGMRVEVFSIGFGNAIFSWNRKGVKWQIGWLPFGGYVKIAGMQKEKGVDPYSIKDGYFGKRPIDRIKVSAMGPLVNLVFAFIICAFIWALGGRDQPFSRFTKRIGFVDPKSKLHNKGVRAGDSITRYDNRPYRNIEDLMFSAAAKNKNINIQGLKIDYYENAKVPYDFTLRSYEMTSAIVKDMYTIGVLGPAQQLFYQKSESPISSLFDLSQSGIKEHDRILWADGEFVFSVQQLDNIINRSTTFLTLQRKGEIFHVKMPRVKIEDLKVNRFDKEEIDDWRHESKIKQQFADLYFLPFYFNENGVIETPIDFVDEKEAKINAPDTRSPFSKNIKRGDRIIAVNGKRVNSAIDILPLLQKNKILMLVQRANEKDVISWKNADESLTKYYSAIDVNKVLSSIGTNKPIYASNDVVLLKPINPQKITDLHLDENQKQWLLTKAFGTKNVDLEKEKKFFEAYKDKYILEMPFMLTDQKVKYNPNPFTQFKNIISQIGHIITSLFTGQVKFKWLAGPIGIVKIIHQSWKNGGKEALSWMAFISINLGVINLLPIPALDGGHMIFAIIEMIRRKPISIKVMEMVSFVFFILLFLGLIYLSYQDILRLVKGIF